MAKQNPHAGHRQRLKQEFLEQGMDHFPPHRVLEYMLFYASPRGDTNEIGHALIDRFGSLSAVVEAPRELLLEVEGVGPEMATFLKSLLAFNRAYLADLAGAGRLENHAAVKEYARSKFVGDGAERVYLICLGANRRLLYAKAVAEGTPETVTLSARDLVREALLANATNVILAHNHPNGVCNPSRKDLQTTTRLIEAFAQVGVELIDHIIVGADDVCSMEESGMFPRPREL